MGMALEMTKLSKIREALHRMMDNVYQESYLRSKLNTNITDIEKH